MAGVLGPILIHLLIRPRFKRIPFTMIDFLELSQKQSQATRRLREWLILLLRCAMVALLACMFALPFFRRQGEPVDRPERHFLVVDNSLSMTYQDQGRSQLDRAIEKASQYVRDRQAGPVLFDIYSFCGDHYGSQLEPAPALDALKRITATAHKADMTEVVAATREALGTGEDSFMYLVSDFTSSAVESLGACQSIRRLQGVDYDRVAVAKPANVLIKGARVLRYRAGTVELLVEVENVGATQQQRRLGAWVKGSGVGVTRDDIAIDLEPAQSAQYVLKFKPNGRVIGDDFLPLEIALSPPDALAVDDTYFLGLHVEQSPQQRILIYSRTPRQGFLVQEALKAISRAEFDNNLIIRPNQGPLLERGKLGNSDILICGHIRENLGQHIDDLKRFLAQGGTAVFFVSRDIFLPSAQRLYNEGIIGAEPMALIDERAALSDPWPSDLALSYAGLDVETARAVKNYSLHEMPLWSHFACRKAPEAKCLWPIETGHSLIYTLAQGAGRSLLINTSMDDSMSSLSKRAVVVPLCRMMLGSASTAHGYGFPAEAQITLPLLAFEQDPAQAQQGIWVMDPAGDKHKVTATGSSLTVPCPEQTGWLQTLSDPLRYAGINPASGETDLHVPAQAEIDRLWVGLSSDREPASQIEQATASIDSQRPLWRLLAWIIIGLILIEGLLVNRIKR